ncbi:MAG: metal-dependent transcriptional regulator [Burkholderiales bacterium]
MDLSQNLSHSLSHTEENYLATIYQLSQPTQPVVSTNSLAAVLQTSPAAVTDMVQRLHQKGWIHYQKYQGVTMADVGKKQVLQILRRHRLWEVFLVKKLGFAWDEVDTMAGQLKHIHSDALIQRLDEFLDHPAYSPHGEPIPDASGHIHIKPQRPLTELDEGTSGTLLSVKEGTSVFLQYLSKRGIYLGAGIRVIEKISFDQSMDISIDGKPKFNISLKVSDNLLVAS